MKLKGNFLIALLLLMVIAIAKLKACVPQVNWGATISFCQGNSFSLNAFNANSTYLWSTGATSSSLLITTSGTYWVQVTNACGTGGDTIVVNVDEPLNVNLGADRNICGTTPTILSASSSASALYQWSTGSTDSLISVSQSGTYWVEAINACGTYTDTVQLVVENPPINILGPDITPCTPGGVTLNLDPSVSGSYLWSDGTVGNSITVSQTGDYWIRVANACGVYWDTINVTYLVQGGIFSSDTITYCTGGSITLSTGVNANSYLWSTGSTSPSITISQPGQVWVRLNTSCGQIFDTVQIVTTNITSVDLGPDAIICDSDPLVLNAGNLGSTFNWSTGATSQSITVSSSGAYWVGVNNGCGFIYDTVNVTAITSPVLTIPDSIYVCSGGSSPVQDAGFWGTQTQYLWSNGGTSRLGGTFPPGNHWVQVSNQCDTVTKNFTVKVISAPSFDLGPDTSTCQVNVRLSPMVNIHQNSFLWSTGSTTNRIRAKATGLYWVQVTNPCGVFTDSIFVTINELPDPIPGDTIYKCQGYNELLSLNAITGTHYQWSTGDTNHYIFAATQGNYWVRAWHECDTMYDTVFVQDVTALNIDLGSDTLICRPFNSLIYDFSALPADSIIWDGTVKADIYNATVNGLHWVNVFNACGVYTDSVMVTVTRVPRKLLRDTSYCFNAAVTLNAYDRRTDSYLWNNGDTSSSISVNQTGWYYVDLSNGCGTTRDSAYVRIDYNLPNIDLGPDTLFCSGTISLDPGVIPGAYYLWQNGDTNRVQDVNSSGTYYVQVYNACNSVYDSITVSVTGAPVVTLGNSVRFCRGSTINLNAQNPGCSYLWSTGDTTQTLSITNPGIYWVSATNDCGSDTDSITVIVEDPLNSLNIGIDTSICRGDSILLDTKIPGVSTKWGNGSTTSSIYVSQTGSYWVEVSNSCGTWDDTIVVTVLDIPNFDLGATQALCSTGSGLIVSGPDNMLNYLWSTGNNTKDLLVTSPGDYWLTVSNECFSFTDSIVITEDFPLNIDLGSDTILCEGELLELNISVPITTQIQWNDGSTGMNLTVGQTGVYFVLTTNACGIFTDTIDVVFDKFLEPGTEELVVCTDDSIAVDLRDIDADFVWDDGATDKLRYFDEEGVYSIYINNRCGSFQKDFVISVSNCECPFFTANAFTPNGDGLNDEFRVTHSCDLVDFKIQIFSRWGKMVFESSSAEQGWDGRLGGELMPPGIYTYSISYAWDVYSDRYMRYKTGTLTLVR